MKLSKADSGRDRIEVRERGRGENESLDALYELMSRGAAPVRIRFKPQLVGRFVHGTFDANRTATRIRRKARYFRT